MSESEAINYEKYSNFKLYLNIRKYDEKSKVIGVKIKNMDHYKNLCRSVLN